MHSCQGGPRGPAPAPAAPLPSPAARHVRNRNEAMGVAEDTRICGFSFKLLQQSAQAVANQEGKCGYRPKQQRRPDAITRAGGRGPYQQCVESERRQSANERSCRRRPACAADATTQGIPSTPRLIRFTWRSSDMVTVTLAEWATAMRYWHLPRKGDRGQGAARACMGPPGIEAVRPVPIRCALAAAPRASHGGQARSGRA